MSVSVCMSIGLLVSQPPHLSFFYTDTLASPSCEFLTPAIIYCMLTLPMRKLDTSEK